MIDICSSTKFLVTEPLAIGPFLHVIEYDPFFETKLPLKLGFEGVEDNICEGVVIRPFQETSLFNGKRIVIKKKNERFAEITGRKVVKGKKQQISPYETPNGSDLFNTLFEDFERYFNSNRFDAVISKIGSVSPNNSQKLMGLLLQDALQDFVKTNEDVAKLSKIEFTLLKKTSFPCAAAVVQGYFSNK